MQVLEGFRRAADFKGRSSRDEFVGFFGPIVVVIIVLSVLAGNQYGAAVLPLILLGLAICAIPAFSLTIRRLHDQNREPKILGGIILLIIGNNILQAVHARVQYTAMGSILQLLVWGTGIAFFGAIAYVIYLGCQPGDEGDNAFGPPHVRSVSAAVEQPALNTPLDVAQPTDTQNDPLAQIERLSKLRDAGVLTEDEFSAQKASLLSRL